MVSRQPGEALDCVPGAGLKVRARLVLPQYGAIEAPRAAAGEENVEEREAIQDCGVPAIHRREEGAWEMRHEIRNSHIPGENKGDHTRIGSEQEQMPPPISISP